MGIPDLGEIFDLLDQSKKGFVTVDHLCQFHESVHFSAISEQHVEEAVKQICGSSSQGKVSKEYFLQVLQEMDRRQLAEQQARWDFLALDKNASYQIPVKEALLLMRSAHGPLFSMHTWKKFLDSRENSHKDVYFDEIKMWLVNQPEGSPSDSNEINEEEERLTNVKQDEADREYQDYKNRKESSTTADQEQEEKTRRMARRKLDKWQNDGLEALLFDDGLDQGNYTSEPTRNTAGVNDLLDALEIKYDALRRKLLWAMLGKSMDAVMWSSMSDSDQLEAFRELEREERQMRKVNSLSTNAAQLPGADISQDASLQSMMGELETDYARLKNDLHDRRLKLKSDGKSDEEVDKILQQENTSVPCHSAKILLDLHQRFQQERTELLNCLQADGSNRLTSSYIINALCRLARQQQLTELEDEFKMAAVAVGLAERKQTYKPECFDPDRVRQVSLARGRLEQQKTNQLKSPGYELEGATKNQGLVDMYLAVVKAITWKHILERQAMVTFLTGQESGGAKSSSHQMSAEQRAVKLTLLRNQRIGWRNSSADYKISQKKIHHKLLQEGVGLYYESCLKDLMNKGLSTDDAAVCSEILADLQQKQDLEFEAHIIQMNNMKEKALASFLTVEQAARVEEHLDCLATVVLGSFETHEQEAPFIAAVEEKYNALRHVLLQHALEAEHGLGWETMEFDEKQRLLARKKTEEKKMRQDGRLDDMAALVAKIPKDVGSLRELMGEDHAQYRQRVKSLQEQQAQAMLQGQPLSSLSLHDEPPASERLDSNLLFDLLQRCYAEQDALLSWVRSPEQRQLSERQRQIPLVFLKLETRKIERETLFDIAALSASLSERVQAALEERHPEDCVRQMKLGRLRAELRKKNLELGRPFNKELDQLARPEKGDLIGWQESYLSELDKKHVEEREVLLLLLQDPSMEDLRQVAMSMSAEERSQRLLELQAKRHKLDLDVIGDREENLSVLEEATALQSVQRQLDLAMGQGSEVTLEEVTVILLTDLQDVQDRELAQAFAKLTTLDEEALKRFREIEIKSRHQGAADNVLLVLTRCSGGADEDELLKALEDKYDALKDKLLLEALMNQMGEAEWKLLSEEERQRRLLELKLKEKKLRREGRFDELDRLLGEGQKADETLRKLMGDHRAEYNRKLKERLARRQKRIDEGLDPMSEDEDLGEEDDDDKRSGLAQLQSRYEQDRAALLARLRGMGDDFLSEQERQAELVRLRREKRRADDEDNFENAALIIGLAERQNAQMEERLKKDRARQEQLARERLEALRNKRGEKMPPESQELVRDGGVTHLQDIILLRLDEKHTQERLLLAEMPSETNEEERLIARASSPLERDEKLQELKSERNGLAIENMEQNKKSLLTACAYKLEGRLEVLCRQKEGEIKEEDLVVTLMADLQEHQDQEAEKFLKDIQNKSESALVEMQATVLNHIKYQRADNVAAMLFAAEHAGKAGEDALVDALESKYDALRHKLMAEALMQQCGEAAWVAMSDRERQRRLAELKLKEKQLRKAGRMDEAALLLGEALTTHEHLEKLMGDNRAEQERKIKERLEKRKKRLAEGMSEEEVDRLELEDIVKEDEEEKKKRNVLLDLQHTYDKEKEELMRRLQGCGDWATAERFRQQEMVRLRREQRKARQEDMFDAAALVLGLAQEHEKAQQADRDRQERLARERLAARQSKAGTANKGDSPSELAKIPEIQVPSDTSNIVYLREALLQEMELKHRQEREAFVQILQDVNSGEVRLKAQELNAERQQERLEELQELRDRWRQCGELSAQEQQDLFKEAAAVKLEVVRAKRESDGLPGSEEDLQVALLADLQQQQDQELFGLRSSWEDKNSQEILHLKQAAVFARQEQKHENIACVLLKSGPAQAGSELENGMTEEEAEVVDALNKKYDALRDKLLMEALMKECGEAEWASLSEKERQQKLVQLKLQERKLRREGRYDEAAELLGKFTEEEAELQRKLGDSQSEQKRKVEERLKRRKELLAEREAKGLSTDGTVLDAIIIQEEEEQENKRKNILENLQHHYEDEKAALLAALRGENERFSAERRRQFELAKLKQQQKRLAQEDKFDGAALLLSIAQQQEKALEASLMTERERQRQLARERIAAKRRQQYKEDHETEEITVETTLQELQEWMEQDKQEELSSAGDLAEVVLSELDKKQAMERDLLWSLTWAAQRDAQGQAAVAKMTPEDKVKELEELEQKHSYWQNRSHQMASHDDSADKEASLATVAELRTEQFKLLTSAMIVRLQMEHEQFRSVHPDKNSAEVEEEIIVNLLADLQQKQTVEQKALDTLLQEQDAGKLRMVRDNQKAATLQGWADNLTNTLFSVPETLDIDGSETNDDNEEVLQQLEAEFEQEKQELQEKLKREARPGETVDLDAELARLEAQQEARRKAIDAVQERQRHLAREKLEMKRRARDMEQYEQDAAMAMLKASEDRDAMLVSKATTEKDRQKQLMQQRLAARRDARRQAMMSTPLGQVGSSSESGAMSDSSRPSTRELTGRRLSQVSSRSSLLREKTAFDLEVTEDEKASELKRLLGQQDARHRRISIDLQHQQEKLQRRLQARKGRRQEEAVELLRLGERQRTTLERSMQGERDRQIQMVQERVARVRYERTQTMKGGVGKKAKQFSEMADDAEQNLTEDEKMALVAKKMEEKFKQEEQVATDRKISVLQESGDAGASPRKLTEDDRMAILKQKRMEKKKQRQQKQ